MQKNQTTTTKKINSITTTLSLVMGLCLTQTCFAEASKPEIVKIATVDMQRALQSVEQGKKAKAQLEKEYNAKKKELQAEEANLKKLTEDFKKQSLVMSDDARAKKQAELQEKIMKFQEMTARAQNEIQQKERDLTQPILAKLRTIISEAAKDKAYSVVLDKDENKVLYSLEKDDLTSEVISLFNKQAKSDKGSKESA